jgi:hypothetical protein
MHAERRPWTRLGRLVVLAGIGLAGLISIVGSGGGSVGFAPCGPPLCDSGEANPQPLAVSIEPADATAQVGAAVTFDAVESSHYGNLSYQWRRSADGGVNFVDIEGAVGSSLTLSGVNLADDGAIFLVVARASGSLTAQAVARLSVSATPPRTYQDGEFDLSGWTVVPWIPPGTPAFTPSVERVAGGGNPGAFLKTSLTMPSGIGSVTVLYLSNHAVHDPAVDGAILGVDYAEDCAALLRGTATSVQSFLLIEQSGRRYLSPTAAAACLSSTWKTVANRSALRATDFTQLDGSACPAAQACPDFSATAAPLRLGFARVTRSYPNESSADGIDNWQVSVWRR